MTQKRPRFSAECDGGTMKKKTVLWLLLDLVFLIVFNVVFFVAAGTQHPASVWLSYGCIHFAYLAILATPFLTRKSSSSAVFGFSIYSISSTYFLVEFVTGLVFICLKQESVKTALIVQVILAGLYAVLLISHLIANESTADSIERHEAEVAYVKTAASKVKLLMGKGANKDINKKIERAYDALHASPTKTTEGAKTVETQINNAIIGLEAAVDAQDETQIIACASEIEALVEERNRRIRNAN